MFENTVEQSVVWSFKFWFYKQQGLKNLSQIKQVTFLLEVTGDFLA